MSTITVPVALTERVAEKLDPITVLKAIKTRKQARKACSQTLESGEFFVRAISTEHGGFAWEVIEASLDSYHDGERMTKEEFKTFRKNAIAVAKGEQTMEDVAEYVRDIDPSGNIVHAGVAFLVMAAKHQLNDDVEVRRFHNTRYRGWVIRPAINNLRASIETKRHGAVHPAVAIVTDKNDVTHFTAFKNCWEADFKGVSNWQGETFKTIDCNGEVSEFVSAIQVIVDDFNSKTYNFMGTPRNTNIALHQAQLARIDRKN